MVAIWYVVKRYPKVIWGWKDDVHKNGTVWHRGLLGGTDRLPSRHSNPLPSDINNLAVTKDKDSLLKWFHYESVLCLHHEDGAGKIIPEAWEAPMDKIFHLRRVAQVALSQRISSGTPYRAEDEVVDRLVFLARELCSEGEDCTSIRSRITKRIELENVDIQEWPENLQEGVKNFSPKNIRHLQQAARKALKEETIQHQQEFPLDLSQRPAQDPKLLAFIEELQLLAIIDVKFPEPLPASKPTPLYCGDRAKPDDPITGLGELRDSVSSGWHGAMSFNADMLPQLVDQEVRHRML
jgi:hypothetical protein